jgi:hypothetical protein
VAVVVQERLSLIPHLVEVALVDIVRLRGNL